MDSMGHNLPSSNEFKPRDDELIQVFLYNKITGKPLPNYATIFEYDLFGEKNPWEIWEAFGGSNSYGGRELYFFTTIKKKYRTSSRLDRTIGLGAWRADHAGKEVVAKGTNQCVGMKKFFRFEKSGTDQDGAWIMDEYSLDPSLLSNPSANNYVLCRIRKKTRQEETSVTSHKVAPKRMLGWGKIFTKARTRNESKRGDKKTKVIETTTSGIKEQEDGNLTMSWPELFSLQLRKINQGGLIQDQEKDIPMLPNTFYKDMLSEKIDNQ